MAIVTKNPHAWFTVTNAAGKSQTVYNNESPENDYPFGWEVNFGSSSEPKTSTVTLYNMSKDHRNFYAKKQKCVLSFNWGPTKKTIAEGFITKIDTTQHDGVTDSQVITFTEGTDYSNVKARRLKVAKKKKVKHSKTVKAKKPGKWVNHPIHVTVTKTYKEGKKKGQKYTVHHLKKHMVYKKGKTVNHRVKTRPTEKTVFVNRVFKKGTTYKQLIQGIARAGGLKIAKIQLAKNPKLKRPFTAKEKPLTLLKQVVKKTGSELTYVGAKLEIIDPKNTKRSWFVIDDQDLVQPPTFNEDDDSDKKTWEITVPLVPEITTYTGIIMKSKYLKGKFYVVAGQHTSDGTNPQTQCSIVAL